MIDVTKARALAEELRFVFAYYHDKRPLHAADTIDALIAEVAHDEQRVADLMADVQRIGAERDALARDASRVRSDPGELPRFVSQCWGCEGRPSGDNDPCEVCGRSAMRGASDE